MISGVPSRPKSGRDARELRVVNISALDGKKQQVKSIKIALITQQISNFPVLSIMKNLFVTQKSPQKNSEIHISLLTKRYSSLKLDPMA